jgi:hypothetical protein
MPMTCHKQTVSAAAFTPAARPRTPHFVLLLLNPINAHSLHEAVAAALARLRAAYDAPELLRLAEQHAAQPHRVQLAIFFVLLNIDIDLKQYVLDTDLAFNASKLCRFFVDLRSHVDTLFATEQMSLLDFVDACEEAYVLA